MGTFYYDVGGLHYDDNNTPLEKYFGHTDSAHTKLRTMRVCPARRERVDMTSVHSYNMPIGTYNYKFGVVNANVAGSPFFAGANYWPNLKSCPNPSQYVMLIDCNGNTLNAGQFHDRTTLQGTGTDSVVPIQRHSAIINALFGDYHAEGLTINKVDTFDVNASTSGNPASMLN